MSVGINGLSITFQGRQGPVRAVRDVSLTIGPGRIMGLVGESGSGKSTVALSVLGLLAANGQVTAGTLRLGADTFDLTNSTNLQPLRGRRVAMVFQDPFTSLNPVFSVRAHLTEALTRRLPDASRVERDALMSEALTAVGLSDPALRLAQYPFQLSGGMRQRIAIAMALLARPDLLIADEPTTALDATVEAQVMDTLLALRDRIGCAILLITHSLGLVARYCDDMAVMYAGEMAETGPMATVAATPRHPYSRALLACEVGIDAPRALDVATNRFQVIPGDLPNPLHLPPGCVYAPRCDHRLANCTIGTIPTLNFGRQSARCLLAGEWL